MLSSRTLAIACFIVLSGLLFLGTGCRFGGGFGGSSDVGAVGATGGPTAPIGSSNLRIVFAGATDSLALSVNPSILAANDAKARIQVTVVRPSDVSQHYTYSNDLPLVASGTPLEVRNLPALPAIIEVEVSGLTVASATRFRGAADLLSGENVVFVNPLDSGLTYDLAAAVLQELLKRPELLKYSGSRLVTDILAILPLQAPGVGGAMVLSESVASITLMLASFTSPIETPTAINVSDNLASPTVQIAYSLREAFFTSVVGLRANVVAQERNQDRGILRHLRNGFYLFRNTFFRHRALEKALRSTPLGSVRNAVLDLPGGVPAIDGPGRSFIYESAAFTPTSVVLSGGGNRVTAKNIQVAGTANGIISKIILTGGSSVLLEYLSPGGAVDNSLFFVFKPGVRIEMNYSRLSRSGFFRARGAPPNEKGILDGWLATETIVLETPSGQFGFVGESRDFTAGGAPFRFDLSLMGMTGKIAATAEYVVGTSARRLNGTTVTLSGGFSKEVRPGSENSDRQASFQRDTLTINLGLETRGTNGENIRLKRLWLTVPNLSPWTGVLAGSFNPLAGLEIKGVSGGAELDFGGEPPAEFSDLREVVAGFDNLALTGATNREIADGANLLVTKRSRNGSDYDYRFISVGGKWKLVTAPPTNLFRGGTESAEQVDSTAFPGRAAWKFTGSRRFRGATGKELLVSFQTLKEFDESATTTASATYDGSVRSLFATYDPSTPAIAGNYYPDLRQTDDGINLLTRFTGDRTEVRVQYAPGFTTVETRGLNFDL